MTNIRRTSNIFPIKKGKAVSESKEAEQANASSSFSVNPTQTLKSLMERRSKQETEEQRLGRLQRALQDFSQEARNHLPRPISEFEKKMHQKMVEEGFTDVIANEAGEEAVEVLLENRRVQPTPKKV